MKKRIAIIDLGTNTFNLLVLEITSNTEHSILYSSSIGVGLGLGGINENKIAQDAFERGVNTLADFKRITSTFLVEEIIAIGTSALRNAQNGESFKAEVKKALDIDIQIISGEEEAELIHKGAFLGYQLKEPTLIMDIGGGSTEFILCDEKGIIKSQSFEIGVARILQRNDFSDPYSKEDIQVINTYLDKALSAFMGGIEVNTLTGTSGSFETFYALHNNIQYPIREYAKMEQADLIKTLDDIIHSTYAARVENKFIIPIRQRMLPIAAIKVKYIIEKIGCDQILISPFSLKEGILNKCLHDVK